MTDTESEDSADFRAALLSIVRTCQTELGYNPSELTRMISELGAVGAAIRLLTAPNISEGYGRLAALQRLDLTVEAHVLRPEYSHLFTPDQLAIARRRLE